MKDKKDCVWCQYLEQTCPRCKKEQEPPEEEEQPAMIFKCGCMYGKGRYIKLCWKHGG